MEANVKVFALALNNKISKQGAIKNCRMSRIRKRTLIIFYFILFRVHFVLTHDNVSIHVSLMYMAQIASQNPILLKPGFHVTIGKTTKGFLFPYNEYRTKIP